MYKYSSNVQIFTKCANAHQMCKNTPNVQMRTKCQVPRESCSIVARQQCTPTTRRWKFYFWSFKVSHFNFCSSVNQPLNKLVHIKAVPKRPYKRLQTSGKTTVPDGATPEVSRSCAEGANYICKREGQCGYLRRTLQVCEEVPSQRCQVVPRTQCNQVRILLLVESVKMPIISIKMPKIRAKRLFDLDFAQIGEKPAQTG